MRYIRVKRVRKVLYHYEMFCDYKFKIDSSFAGIPALQVSKRKLLSCLWVTLIQFFRLSREEF